MFHRHVVTFLKHRIFISDIRARSNVHGCWASFSIVACSRLESLLTSIKHHSVFQVTVSRQTLSLGATRESTRWRSRCCICILSRTRDFELQTLTVEYLIITKSGRSSIESQLLPCKVLIVICTLLPIPAYLSVVSPHRWCSSSCSDTRALVSQIILWVLRNILPHAFLARQQPDLWVCRVYFTEPISLRFEKYALRVGSLSFIMVHSSRKFLCLHTHCIVNIIVVTGTRCGFGRTLSEPTRVASKCSDLETVHLRKISIWRELQQWFAHWRVLWLRDVYVLAWTGLSVLSLSLVASSDISSVEWNFDSLFLENFTFKVFFLLFLSIFPWARIGWGWGSCEWRIGIIQPGIALRCLRLEYWLCTKLGTGRHFLKSLLIFTRIHIWISTPFLLIFAIRDFRQEDWILSICIEVLFLICSLDLILARSRVLSSCLGVFNRNCRLEHFSLLFRRLEINSSARGLICRSRIIASRANCVGS